ncbi:MAG: Ig-like domain-containing protein [Acutalibacteraceae bacterium]|nr:Ig-like domain-containing protein [Acutalibacteraceae bacterium]
MKKTKRALALLLCIMMTATTFSSMSLSASAEEYKFIDTQAVASEMPTENETESETENASENIPMEMTDPVNENTDDEVSSEPVVNAEDYSRNPKNLQNESSAENNSVEISNSPITLGVGETYTFSKASLQKTLSATSTTTYKWSSSSSNIVSVNSDGKITAKKVGETTINVVASNGKKAFCRITVKNAPTKITLNKTTISLGVGETFDLNASLPSGTASYSVKYSSNSTGVATVNSASGFITAKKVGTAVITATTYNGKKATCIVTVKNAPTKVTLNKTAITLGLGETFDLNASLPSGTVAYNVKYSSNNTGVATVDSYGITTAKKAGTAVITVVTYNGKKATCTVTVKNAPTKITLNKTTITLGVGETFDLNSSLPSGTASYSVKYSSNSIGVATVTSSNGLITAKKVGTAVITAITYNGKKATCKVIVKNAPTKITLNKTTINLGVGETFDLNSSLPSGTASYSVKYSSNSTGVATVTSSNGLITAKKVGTAVITATTYNGKKATCTVTVKNAPTKVTLNKTAITLGVGETFDLNASLPSGTVAYNVKYLSNNTGVATVDSYGITTAKKAGTAVITVKTYNGKTATCTVTVKNAPTKITLNKTTITLGVGETFDLNSSLPSGTASYSVKYSSNSTGVATVTSSNGLITAKKVGRAVITAITYNGKKATCTVIVKNAPTKVTLNKTTITLEVGKTFDLNASLPSGTAAYSVKYSSNSTSVATVDSYGIVTAKKAGTAVVTVTTYNGKKATCKVTVKNAPTKITLNKTTITLGVGETFALNASLSSGTVSSGVKYSSNSTGVATVNASNGLITAKKAGTAVITATINNGSKATCTVTVKNSPTKITLNKTKITLSVGETFDLNSSLPSGTAAYSVKYSSNSTSVATVDSYGIVTAKKAGTAVITVTTYNGKKATCTVTVKKGSAEEEYINEVLRLTNEERKKAGLPTLAKRADVDKVAAIRAKEISVKYSHTRPNGKSCFTVVSENGISYMNLGENLATGQLSPKEVVNDWMNSEAHRKNILNPKFNGLGVGYYVEDGTTYWIQMLIG